VNRNITARATALTVAIGLAIATVATGVGPDVIVGDLDEVASNGSQNGISAFAVGTVSCNIGDFWLNWYQYTDQHPVIGQNMYRLKDNRFEQIGMSWLKHGFYALSEELCHSDCVPTDGTHLGVHCSDPYTAGLNATQSRLGPKYQVNAHTGVFTWPKADPPYSGAIARRLQVHNTDLDPSVNGGGLYFVEGHYVTPDDAAAGNQNNNASYRRVTVGGSGSTWTLYLKMCNGGPRANEFCTTNANCPDDPACPSGNCTCEAVPDTQRQQSAIRAWKDTDPTVVETDAQVQGEGLFILSAKVTDLGACMWHYEYALQNLNSDRSGGSFTVSLPEGVILENIGFHDVDYHDGDGTGGVNWDGTDWPASVEVGKITWATTPYSIDPRANALRWGTLYNFRFDANVGPANTTMTLGLFKPGSPSDPTDVNIGTIGPAPVIEPCEPFFDCNDNDIPDSCDVDCGGLECAAFPECVTLPDCAINANGDGNGVPDECEVPPIDPNGDCNTNTVPDECDIFSGFSQDCQLPNGNGVPDECEPDCDGDDIPDTCETITDTDGDGVDDCDDLCPETTPVNACVPPATVTCCFCASPIPLCITEYPRTSCSSNNGTAICSEPPLCSGTVCRESQCRDGCRMGDFDRDGDLDLFDVGALQTCFSAPVGNPAYIVPSAECLLRFDFDDDSDVDDDDYVEFLATYTGP